MSITAGLSQIVWTDGYDHLFTFEKAATLSETSIALIEQYIVLGLIEPVGIMLPRTEIIRIIRLRRLRRDLGLNLVGAAMVLDMANEISQLKAQLAAHQTRAASKS